MDAAWFEPIRAYCERTDGTFWSEPVNALTNVAFLVAAAAALARALKAGDRAAAGLSILVPVIGLGSFLFHTHANRWTMLADVGPIALFVCLYLALALHRFLGLSRAVAGLGAMLYVAAGLGFGPLLEALTGRPAATFANGSVEYLPALAALCGVGWAARGSEDPIRHAAGTGLLGVAGLFLVSLAFRTLDRAACPAWPLGTHFLWHLLNAVVLFALVAVAVRAHRTT